MSGDYEGGLTRIDHLIVKNDSVVRFWQCEDDPADPDGCYAPHLFIKYLEIQNNSILTLSGEGIAIYIKDNGAQSREAIQHIAIEINGERRRPRWILLNGNHYLGEGTDPWGPIPEPSTYGATFGVLGLSLWGWRRRKNKPHAGGTLSLVCAD